MEKIREYVRITENIHTAGQPTGEQLSRFSEHGIRYVVNLALPTSDGAVADEALILARQGIGYFHLPVVWERPTIQDFTVFCGLMRTVTDFPVFVHCALNMRVSAFMFLYRVTALKIPPAEAYTSLEKIWEPYEQWRTFITNTLNQHGYEGLI
jgi:protein tyrosine phosphatase (PTP) superfamily phosphohydrolase (DUF442 family)